MSQGLVSRLVRMAAVVVVAGLLVIAPSRAQAQFGMGMGAMPDASISRRTVESIATILGMDKDQKEAVLTLLEGYKNDQKALNDKMQEGMKKAMDDARETQDWAGMQKEAMKAAKVMAEKTRTLESTFFGDFKATLTDTQMQKWPQVEQYRRRDKFMRVSFASGAAVDLVQVIARVKAKAANNTEFESTLDRYQQDMDKHLVEMEKAQKETEEKMFNGDSTNMMDMTKITDMLKGFYTIAKDMRDTNKEYSRKLGLLLDDSSREKFEAEVRTRAFPAVYRPAHVVKMMDEAVKLPDLDKAKKEEITNLRAAYVRDAALLNDKWAKAVEERDDKGGGTLAVMMAGFTGGAGDLSKDVNAARTSRKELDSKTKERLESFLTEDQKNKLPAPPPSNPNPMADFMPQNDDEEPSGG